MMNFPEMLVPIFINREPRQLRYSTGALNGLLYGLMLADMAWLKAYPKTVAPYKSDVRYTQEPPGQEKWQSVPAILANGKADCEDLAAWRSAHLRVTKGVEAIPRNIWRLVGTTIRAHAFVVLPDGSTEDPSEVLGMPPAGLHRPGRPWPGGPPDGHWTPPRGATY